MRACYNLCIMRGMDSEPFDMNCLHLNFNSNRGRYAADGGCKPGSVRAILLPSRLIISIHIQLSPDEILHYGNYNVTISGMIEIREYIDNRGRSPFGRWFDGVRHDAICTTA